MKKNVTGAKAKISAEEFDQLADSGSDKIDRYLDWENARRPALEIKRTTLDLPARLLNKIDRAAALRGVTRQSLIKVWLHERVESEPEAALKAENR
jgi:predicted DNA binding CopG/RHH family protein